MTSSTSASAASLCAAVVEHAVLKRDQRTTTPRALGLGAIARRRGARRTRSPARLRAAHARSIRASALQQRDAACGHRRRTGPYRRRASVWTVSARTAPARSRADRSRAARRRPSRRHSSRILLHHEIGRFLRDEDDARSPRGRRPLPCRRQMARCRGVAYGLSTHGSLKCATHGRPRRAMHAQADEMIGPRLRERDERRRPSPRRRRCGRARGAARPRRAPCPGNRAAPAAARHAARTSEPFFGRRHAQQLDAGAVATGVDAVGQCGPPGRGARQTAVGRQPSAASCGERARHLRRRAARTSAASPTTPRAAVSCAAAHAASARLDATISCSRSIVRRVCSRQV